MKHLFRPLRTLQWQLSLSYVLVVLAALPSLLAVGYGVLLLMPPLSPAEQLVQLLKRHTVVSTIATWMQQPHNTELQAFINQKFRAPTTGQPIQLDGLNTTEIVGFLIINQAGQVVASYPQGGVPITKLSALPAAQAITRAAWANDQRLADLSVSLANGQTLAAVPLLNDQGHPLGVFFVVVVGLRNSIGVSSNPVISAFSQVTEGGAQNGATTGVMLLRLALFLILVTSLLCMVAGIVAARRITRRLRRITFAVHAWSRGQFQVNVTDKSSDELGELVQDLNQMALQVQTQLRAQQQLTLLEERQRMARDLHDSVKQHTFGMTLLIGAGKKYLERDPAQAYLYLTEAEALADQTRQELTAIIQELRPVTLTEKGLATVLREYLSQWSQRTGIVADIAVQEILPLAPEQRENVFRVTQEALTNVMRHSKASKVSVRLSQETEQMYLAIHDNGQGFDVVKATGKGLGLATMRERMEVYQGVVSIASTSEGTIVEVRMPYTVDDCLGGNNIKQGNDL